jgi:hypothetical protein
LPYEKDVGLPAAQNDALQQETVVGADAEEEFLESNGMLKLQGLTVKDGDGLLMNQLTDTEDCWSEVCDILIIGLVDGLVEHLSSRAGLVLFVKETTSNHLLTCMALGEESERVGLLFEKMLVDHDTDLKRKLHQRKGDVL